MASPQFDMIVQMLRSRPRTADQSIEEQRAAMAQLASINPIPGDVRCEPVDAGGVPAEWITTPGAADDRVVLYLHGGGYTVCSIATHRDIIARLSRATQARALALEYRLAPEHPFPAAVDDALAGYRWLLSTGADPTRVAIAGDSSGGGLAVATMVALRDAGEPLPAAAACISPWVDLEGSGESMTANAATDPMIQRENLMQAAKAYLGGTDPHTPLAAPLYADLTGLPPTLIQVGTAEALLDDSKRLAERAKAAGVDVTLEPWDDMIHVWHAFSAMLPEGQQAIDHIGRFLREHMQ